MEIERDHYYWQLISPLHSLITAILETISRQPQTVVEATVRDYITLDLSLLLTHLARYSDIINDHSIGPDDATPLSEDLASIPHPAGTGSVYRRSSRCYGSRGSYVGSGRSAGRCAPCVSC